MYSRKISIAILAVFLVSLFLNNETVHGVLATKTWDGGGTTNNWSDGANWSGDTAPVPGDVVVFDSSSAKDASVDVEVNVASINIGSGYAGTISLNNGVNMTFTGGGNTSSQAGGTFTNGTGTITFASSFSLTGGIFNTKNGNVNFNGSFNQSGGLFNDLTLVNDGNVNLGQVFSNITINGGIFNAPSGTLTANGAFTFTSGFFNHGNGTVVFAGPTNVFLGIQPSEIVFNNLTINKANGSNVALFPQVDRTARVTGTLTLTEGMINANTNSVIRAEAAVSIDPGFGDPANNPPGGNGFLLLQNGAAGRVVSIPAGASLPSVTVDDPNITINGAGSGTIRFAQLVMKQGVMNMGPVDVISGFGFNPCYDQSGGTFSIGTGNFLCQTGFRLEQTNIANPSSFTGGSGNFTLNSPGNSFQMSGGTFTAPTGSTVINTGEFNANLNQSGGTFNANGSFDCQCAAFNLSGGTFNATSGTSTFRRNFNRSAGTFNANGGTVLLTSTPGGGQAGATTFNNLTIAYSGNNHTFSDATVVLGNLVLQSGELEFPGGEFDVKGNITVESAFAGANKDIKLSGSADQVLTNNGGVNPKRNWTVDKPAGRVILATDIDLSNGTVFFNLDNAIIQTGSHLLDLGTRSVFDNGGTPQGSNYIIGNLRRSFTGGGQDITRQFDVGTTTGYARVLVRVPFTPGPTSGTLTPLTISSVSTPHPLLDPSSSVGLFWRVAEGTGLVNADVTFQYPQAGVSGDEANYVLYRINNGQIQIVNSTIFISTNTVTVQGTSDFTGEWAIGERPPQLVLNGPANLITNPGKITPYSASGGRPPYSFELVENNSGATLQQTNATSVNYVAGPTIGGTDRLRLTDSLGTTRDAVISVADPFVVINTNDSGGGSLRQAITNSNETPGVQTISFNLPGAPPYTIQPATPLPSLSDPVVIDGTTQPGFSGAPLIELKGPGTAVGLNILGGGSTVKGLVINNWLVGIRLYYIGGNTISGNYIGTNAAGDQPRPNSVGIFVSTPEGNVIGGASPAERNVISGNDTGVRILAGTANVIKGNYIGLNAAGTVGMNDLSQLRQIGINAETQALTVGGSATGEGNIISGNLAGLVIEDSQGVVVKGNKFGMNATAANAVANGEAIRLQRTQNTQIGGIAAGEGNLIRESLASGIRLLGSPNEVSIRGNSITANAGLGIDTGLNGVSPNTNCGSNAFQNFPVLTSVASNGSGTTITGDLNSRPGEQFTIDFYSNSVADSNGYGEGKTYIGSRTVSTNDQCVRQDFFANLPIQLTTEQVVTATATDSSGRTSEFSAAIGATSAIRGTVLNSAGQPIANTTVSLRDANTQDVLRTKLTDSNGRFEFIGVNTNFDYLVNPVKNNYSFDPPSRTYNLGAAVDDTWTGTLGTNKITGQITMDGVALGGVQLVLSGASTGTEETSLNGNYTFNNLPSGTYTVTPALAGRIFTPASATVTIGGDQTASFTATTPQALLKGRIIFKSGDDIKAINANGTGEMTLLPTNEKFRRAVISPDGRKIAAVSRSTTGPDTIRTYNSDSTGKSGILHSAPVIGSIRWSQPIGSFLLFDKDIVLPATGFTSTIFRMDFQGNNLTQMTNTNGNLLGRTYSPEYSPDGLSIIFGQKLLPVVSSIYRMNFDGSNPTVLFRSDFTPCRYDSSVYAPKWSPDGTKIAFTRDCTPNTPMGPPRSGLYVADADGSNPTLIYNTYYYKSFDWSPDGTRIALDSGGQLTAILPDGTDPIVIRQGEAEALDWGPDNSVATPSGPNTNVQTGSVSITFNTTSGVNKTTTVTPIPPGSAGSVPGGFNIGNMAFEISTTANYTPPILLCFTIPPTSYTTESAFNTLAFMHNENGILVDRTFTRVFASRVVCGVVDSLSPFALGEIIDPALASVNGLVIDQNGNPMRDFKVTLEGDEERFTTTAEDGTFSFSNLTPGGNYTVTPNQLGYFYDFPSQSYIGITGENTFVFTATPTNFDVSGMVKDGAGQPIANVLVKLDGSVVAETSTDANGRYTFANLPANGSFTVSPSPDGNMYTPASKNIDGLMADVTEADFIQAAPTAANVSVSGRVTTANGQGIRGARLTLTAPDGTRRTAVTSSFGYYAFDGVEVGQTYVLEIASKKYMFANPTRVFSLQDTLTDMDFTSEPQ